MKWAFIIFAVLYALAVFLLGVGTFGWLGQEQDPLAGVFLMPLGLPWIVLADWMGVTGAAVMLLAPAINGVILFWLWRRQSAAKE